MNSLTTIQFSVPLNTLTSVSGAQSTDLLTKAAHGMQTGDPFVFICSAGFTGLTSGNRYYAIRIGSSTIKVALTLAEAVAGSFINITADGTGATLLLATPLVSSAGVPIFNDVLLPGSANVFSYLVTAAAGTLGTITLGTKNYDGCGDPKSPGTSLAAFTPFCGADLSALYFLGTDVNDAVDVFANR